MFKKLIVFYLCISLSLTVMAQDTLLFTPGYKLKKGPIRTLFLGKNYRDVWKTGVKAPALDLNKAGLKPTKSGGRLESQSLRMTDSTGRTWVARSVAKDLSKILPSKYRKSFAGNLLRDHAASNEPYAALVVQSLAKEIRILHCTPKLIVLKNDSSLGEFREEYAGMPALFEERPTKGWLNDPLFAYAIDIMETEELIKKRLDKHDFRIDDEMYLKGRLLDMLVGDWSRHDEQFKWAVSEENGTKIVRPIPRDRDHALYKNEGLLKKLSNLIWPYARDFGDDISNISHLNHMAGNMDQLILPGISKERWMKITNAVMHEISDADIDRAVSFLPDETEKIDGEFIASTLKKRLKDLPIAAVKFYNEINKSPFIPSTDEEDEILIRSTKDSVMVRITTIHKKKNKDGEKEKVKDTWFEKTFSTNETHELTIATLDEEDEIRIEGVDPKKMKVKVMVGPGDDTVKNFFGKVPANILTYDTKPRMVYPYLTSGTRNESKKKKRMLQNDK